MSRGRSRMIDDCLAIASPLIAFFPLSMQTIGLSEGCHRMVYVPLAVLSEDYNYQINGETFVTNGDSRVVSINPSL